MPLNKISQTHKTTYLEHVISIAQNPIDQSWSYAVHTPDFQTQIAQKHGFSTYTKALNHAKAKVEELVIANA